MKRIPSTILFFLLFLTAAQAEAVFMHERGTWSVYNTADHCIAANRPAIETNFSPYMALNLLFELRSKQIHVAAYLWPGAFTKGEQLVLVLRGLSGPDRVELPATAQEDYMARTDRALTRDERRALRDREALIVTAGRPPNQMAVETAPNLRYILHLLQNCARFVDGK